MPTFLAAAIQLNSQPDLSVSMELTLKSVKEAAARGADLIALPENFAFMGDENLKQARAESISEAVMNVIPELARKHSVTILAGGFPVRAESGKVYNRAVLVNPDGKVAAQYDKIHLFDVTVSETESYRESATVEAGKPVPVCGQMLLDQNQSAKIGLSVCYDVRFPELYRLLAEQGAEILAVPAAFTRPTGEAHWETLLRARAIENTCFVIAPAQTGIHGTSRKTHGHALIIDPWGRVLSDAGIEPGMALAEINTDLIRDVRAKLPSLQNRRL